MGKEVLAVNTDNLYKKYYKYKIYPNKSQSEFIDKCINLSRYIYNWALDLEIKQYELYKNQKTDKQFLSEHDLRKLLKIHREENEWLKEFPVEPSRYILSRVDFAFKMFFMHKNNYPKFKTKKNIKKSSLSYNIRTDRFYINKDRVKIQGLKRGEFIDLGFESKFGNKSGDKDFHDVKVIKDKLGDYYISFYTYERKPDNYFTELKIEPLNRGIGIDLNARKNRRFVCSDGTIYEGTNIDSKIYKVKQYQAKHQKDYRRLEKMEKTNPDAKLSKRALKRLRTLRKSYRKIHNINEYEVHKFTKNVINMNPKFVVMENLRIVGNIASNKFVANYIHFVPLFRYREVMEYKCNQYDIPFKLADKDYPSSQLCSNCGHQKKMGTQLIYICPNCGLRIDRDLNAAINLEKLGY